MGQRRAARTRRGVELWPALTLARIRRRDGDACPHCGILADTVQHRRRRGSGGSNEAERPSNGVGLCFSSNDADANVAGVRPVMERYGWSVSRYDDPAAVPVYDATSGSWWMLGDDWSRRPATAAEVDAHLALHP